MSEPSASPATTAALPSLPLELVHLILDYAVPPPGYTHWKERSAMLLSLSSTCHGWRATFQRQLFQDVVLRSVKAAQQLREAVRDERLGEMVETIWMGSHWDGQLSGSNGDASKYGVGKLLRRCPHAHALLIGRMDSVTLDEIAEGNNLTFLAIWDSLFTHPSRHCPRIGPVPPEPRLPQLPSIRHLFLEGNSDPDSREHIWKECEATSALGTVPIDDVEYSPSYTPYTSLSLRCSRLGAGWHRDLWEGVRLLHLNVEVLRHLVSSKTPGVGVGFDVLPTSLRYLRVTSGHFFGSDVLTPNLRAQRARLVNLRELILPMRLATAAAFEELRSWAKEEGIVLRWERDEEGQGTVWDEGFWECVRRVERIEAAESVA